MIIEKNGKQYEVAERLKHWLVVLKVDKLSVNFEVSKEICETEAELKKYVEKEDMF